MEPLEFDVALADFQSGGMIGGGYLLSEDIIEARGSGSLESTKPSRGNRPS